MFDYDLIIIGGGAAGIFSAATTQAHKVLILEKSNTLLAKVRVSGGGRCNVTHSCFDPKELTHHYPRGEKELIGPFHKFQPKDTIKWFESRGVKLKTASDGRMFPTTDSSETIINCLLDELKEVEIKKVSRVKSVEKKPEGFLVNGYTCKKLILATGSSSDGYRIAQELGHSINNPVPSLFTFNVPTSPLKELSGVSFDKVELKIDKFKQLGPLLITHFGFSGPASIKLSAWAARYLFEKNYHVNLKINYLPDLSLDEIMEKIQAAPPQKKLINENVFKLPNKFWKLMVSSEKKVCELSKKELRILAEKLHGAVYLVEGKTTHKEEFVTCGGVSLKEVNFKTMESKRCSGLYFAGEILDIDGVTGGFNFQNAWTTGFIAGSH